MKSRSLEHLHQCNKRLKNSSFTTYRNFLETLCSSNDSEAYTLALAYVRKGDWSGLLEYADYISSVCYKTKAEHRLCNLLSALIRKYPFPKDLVNLEPRKRALGIFEMSERKCARINRKFRLFDTLRSPHESSLSLSRQWIAYVLGDFNLPDVQSECDFGAGASIGVHGNATNSGRKLLAQSWSVSTSAVHYSYRAVLSDPLIFELLCNPKRGFCYAHDVGTFRTDFASKVRLVDHNNIAFVPKTTKVERTIAVEPLLNGYLQKGVDNFMRKRLKRVGIDLADQDRNRRLSCEGSLGGPDPYVTIDLSSASDSISIGLCRNLLPPEWFDYLNSIRSPSYKLNGRIIRYHKFTSMGNGFCFPLETLIFASLCNTAYRESNQKPDFSVYGDDIIVRSSVANRVLDLLRICGFTVNQKKTFLSGPFRESCGADWFEGEDVRPLNLDYEFDSIENIFKFVNLSRSKAWWDTTLSECLYFLEALIPKNLRFCRPFPGNVDGALTVAADVFMASPFSRWNKNLQCWSWLEIKHVSTPDIGVKRLSGHLDYQVVLMRGALTGSSSSMPFTERRKTRTKLSRVVSGSGCTWTP